MRYATAYHVGQSKAERGVNEDSVGVTVFEDGHRDGYGSETADGDEATTADRPPGSTRGAGVFVLADGAGGHESGDVASYVATTVIARELGPSVQRWTTADPSAFDLDVPSLSEGSPEPEAIREAVADAVVEAHRAILRHATEERVGAYSTVVVGVKLGSALHYGWVGDSRAYVYNRAHERLEQLTRDHSPVARDRERGEIDEIEALVDPDGNEISRAIGGKPTPEYESASVDVDTASVPLYAADTVLLTSDGLIDAQTDYRSLYQVYVDSDRDPEIGERVREEAVTDDDIGDVLRRHRSPDEAATALVDLANDRGGKDNISLILFEDDSLPSTPPAGALETRTHPPLVPLRRQRTRIVPAGADNEQVDASDEDDADAESADGDTDTIDAADEPDDSSADFFDAGSEDDRPTNPRDSSGSSSPRTDSG